MSNPTMTLQWCDGSVVCECPDCYATRLTYRMRPQRAEYPGLRLTDEQKAVEARK